MHVSEAIDTACILLKDKVLRQKSKQYSISASNIGYRLAASYVNIMKKIKR